MEISQLGSTFINGVAGFAVAAMLAIWGVPALVLLVAQVVLVAISGTILLVAWRRSRRTRSHR
jgi:membrane protein implicated in regulation of membrane protease activity